MKQHDFIISTIDTDSVSFSKQDGSPFSKEEQDSLLEELNSLFPEKINFAHDGIFPKVCVLKAKNYILVDESGKRSIKGSALRSSKSEKFIKDFMGEIIECLLNDQQEDILSVYKKYTKAVFYLKDIAPFCSKKTITDAVLNPSRTTEQKIQDSINGRKVQMGDKIYVYFTKDKKLKMQQDWDGDHDPMTLVARLHSTLKIFENVIDFPSFPKYHLKNRKTKQELELVIGMSLPDKLKDQKHD